MVSAASATTTDPGQRSHLRTILRLGGPLVINNLAYAGITFADTVMAGHISADALAAFHHPFAYATGRGMSFGVATRDSLDSQPQG